MTIEQNGININSVDFQTGIFLEKWREGNTALHAAVTLQKEDLITYLVEKGADCNYRNRKGQVGSFSLIF